MTDSERNEGVSVPHDDRARRVLTVALLLAFAGSVLGLIFGVWLGPAQGAESVLLIACALVTGSLLVLLRLPRSRLSVSSIAAAASLYLTAHLSVGAALTLWHEPYVPHALPYLLWFFALLAFNKFTNTGRSRAFLDTLIIVMPLLLVVGTFLLQSAHLDREGSVTLVLYIFSYLSFSVFFNLFTVFREDYITSTERSLALGRQNTLLRESGERLRRLFDDAVLGIAELDAQGRIISANATLEQLLRVSAGDQLADGLARDDVALWHAALRAVVDGGPAQQHLEITPVGERRLAVNCILSYLPARGQLPAGLVAVFQDITERRELDSQLRQSQKLQAIGQLTGGIAHDFNNLLTVIMGNSELLAESLGEQENLQALAQMSTSAAQRGAELTRRLLAFARRQPLAPQVVDLSQLVMAARPLLQRTLGESVRIDVIADPALSRVEVDPGQFEVALLNLAINARDAMPTGGELVIESHDAALDEDYCRRETEVAPGDYVRVSVSDNGTGIAPGVIEHVFEPFFTTKDAARGNGLGLSMVYGFVKQSGGHVKIYSEPREGTTVHLYFPRVTNGRTPAPDKAVSKPFVGGSEHIVVVEDDDLVRSHAESTIRGLGYGVTVAQNGPEALALLKDAAAPDLLFTDVVMPGGMNGRELAEAAQALHPGLPVLYTSGYAEDAIVHHGRLAAGVQLLSKPYRREQLALAIRQALQKAGD
ncbi:hybrid sensor histidine kinase/response regulator [Chromatocurvus halotolerans]|uniref:histidine kinase n=1 Tax=Chromatocurvus halotolerans TaxID=1132028 RepID=A0A4V2SBS0_9GAMM|nr:ATP-binding protein [Chromatocurvus halotolerans]TCO76640.1 signal transduction histidine kinase [Chromatocurvus halotolerans]